MGRSRGGLTTKIHAVVDARGRPVRLMLTAGQVHDSNGARDLLVKLARRAVVVADKAYDADWIRAQIKAQGAIANIPNKRNRTHRHRFKKALYRERNRIERFFNRLKHSRRVATRYEKLGANFLAMVKLAALRLWLREIESTT
jgi:transposase